MRLLLVSDARSIHTRRWAEQFRDDGMDVHVASFRTETIAGVHIHVLPTYGLGRVGYFIAIGALRRLARQLNPDVVHAQYLTSYGFLCAAAQLHPLVVTAWGSDVLISSRKSVFLRWLAQYAVRRADAVTSVAAHMNPAVAELGVSIDAISAVPFGVDTKRFVPPVTPRSLVPPLRLICTRNFNAIYNVETVIEALRIVKERGLSLQTDLVGDGPSRAALEAGVQRAGLEGSVNFRGHVPHGILAALLAEAHIFVSPALSDGNNVSLNEAMACSSFPIATLIAANSQWIEHGANGLLYAAGEPTALADCIMVAAADSGLRERAGRVNRAIVLERADWSVCVARMRETYANAMNRSGTMS